MENSRSGIISNGQLFLCFWNEVGRNKGEEPREDLGEKIGEDRERGREKRMRENCEFYNIVWQRFTIITVKLILWFNNIDK